MLNDSGKENVTQPCINKMNLSLMLRIKSYHAVNVGVRLRPTLWKSSCKIYSKLLAAGLPVIYCEFYSIMLL